MIATETAILAQDKLTSNHKQKCESKILVSFIDFLATKTDKSMFNVPLGKMETIAIEKLKQFLLLSRDFNCPGVG